MSICCWSALPGMVFMKKNSKKTVVFTIGHSTRVLDAFISLLQAHSVTMVVDIRTVPRSRHNPQFNNETLPSNLRTAGIGYTHMPGPVSYTHLRAHETR